MAAEEIARYKPGKDITVFAEELIPAGRFVVISGDKTTQGDYKAKLAGANAVKVFGVSERTSGPTGDPATSWTRRINVVRRGAVARVQAAAAITAGKEIFTAAEGKAKEWESGKTAVGLACNTVAENGYVEVDLY